MWRVAALCSPRHGVVLPEAESERRKAEARARARAKAKAKAKAVVCTMLRAGPAGTRRPSDDVSVAREMHKRQQQKKNAPLRRRLFMHYGR